MAGHLSWQATFFYAKYVDDDMKWGTDVLVYVQMFNDLYIPLLCIVARSNVSFVYVYINKHICKVYFSSDILLHVFIGPIMGSKK